MTWWLAVINYTVMVGLAGLIGTVVYLFITGGSKQVRR